MIDRPRPQAGGFLLAMSILIGAAIGVVKGQATIGLLIGTGVGVLIAIALWLKDRARTGG